VARLERKQRLFGQLNRAGPVNANPLVNRERVIGRLELDEWSSPVHCADARASSARQSPGRRECATEAIQRMDRREIGSFGRTPLRRAGNWVDSPIPIRPK